MSVLFGAQVACGRPAYVSDPTPVPPAHVVDEAIAIVPEPLAGRLVNCAGMPDQVDPTKPWDLLKREDLEFVQQIDVDAQGRLWFPTGGHGLTLYDGEAWTNWRPETRPEMGTDAFRTFALREGGVLAGAWGGPAQGSLLTFSPARDTWGRMGPADLHGEVIGGLAVNAAGDIYVMVDTYTTAYITTTLSSGETLTLEENPMILLDVFSGGQWSFVRTPPPNPTQVPHVQDGLFDQRGRYWAATGQWTGVWTYDGSTWEVFTHAQGQLPSDDVNALAEDSQGRMWVGTTKGLAVYDRSGTWRAFSAVEYPWFSQWIMNVAVDDQDRVWVVNHDQVVVYNGTEVAVFTPEQATGEPWDDAIAFDSAGCAWIDTFSGMAILHDKVAIGPGDYPFDR